MKLFQGRNYVDKDQAGAEPNVQGTPAGHVEQSDTEPKIPHKKLICGVVGILVIVLIAYSVAALVSKKKPEEQEPGDLVSIENGDDYWEEYEIAFSYSDEDKETLRAWGYTGDEIEKKQQEEVPVDQLVEESRKAQEDMRKTLSNPISPEYQKLLNDTWLGQAPMSLPTYQEGMTEDALTYVTRTYNADYDKIPAHGRNLFLKVYLPDKSYAFMECDVLRYMQLPESGNIVVTYTEVTYGSSTVVCDMQEVYVE